MSDPAPRDGGSRRTGRGGLSCGMDLLPAAASLSRFVAMGDSLTAGRGDFGADGIPIGWAQRLAVILSQHTGVPCQLTNLAFDGAKVGAVLSRQLPRLTELAGRGDGAGPDLVSLTVGINDIKARDFRAGQFTADFGRLLAALASTGATVLTCTLPDIAAAWFRYRRSTSRLPGSVSNWPAMSSASRRRSAVPAASTPGPCGRLPAGPTCSPPTGCTRMRPGTGCWQSSSRACCCLLSRPPGMPGAGGLVLTVGCEVMR